MEISIYTYVFPDACKRFSDPGTADANGVAAHTRRVSTIVASDAVAAGAADDGPTVAATICSSWDGRSRYCRLDQLHSAIMRE